MREDEREPLTLLIEADWDEDLTQGRGIMHDPETDQAMIRISNPAAENGYPQRPGPLTWLNSARIVTDPTEDSVTCLVSVADPRGAFAFTVRRRPDTGELLIHVPHPGEGMPHCRTKWDHDGTLVVVGDSGEPRSFADEVDEMEDEDQ